MYLCELPGSKFHSIHVTSSKCNSVQWWSKVDLSGFGNELFNYAIRKKIRKDVFELIVMMWHFSQVSRPVPSQDRAAEDSYYQFTLSGKRQYTCIVSWEPEGCYCSSKMFRWEPEGRYCCTKSVAIAPFWFSTEHLWSAIAPFWLSADDIVYTSIV